MGKGERGCSESCVYRGCDACWVYNNHDDDNEQVRVLVVVVLVLILWLFVFPVQCITVKTEGNYRAHRGELQSTQCITVKTEGKYRAHRGDEYTTPPG